MATIASIFGAYAASQNLQYLIDKALDKFEPTWFDNYFEWGSQQLSLSYETVLGRSRVEAAASVVDRGSKAPLRSRGILERYTGKISPIMEKFALDETTLREHLLLRNLPGGGDIVKSQIIDLITDDVTKAGNSTMKRLDIMALEAISKGSISLTVDNNPDGVVLADPLNLLMPAANKVNATVSWTGSPTTATPINDFMAIRTAATAKGIRHVKALMTFDAFWAFIATTQVKDMFNAYVGKSTNKLIPDFDTVNEFLSKQKLPVIELVDVSIGIEKDGKITPINPFETNNIAFVPDGKLGKIHNAYAIEDLQKINQVSYAKYNRTLISKWGDNDPYQEYTKAELNAMPGLEAIDSIYLLSRTASFV